MQEDKSKSILPVKYTLQNTVTGSSVDHMLLVPRDMDVLNKVFIKHKVPVKFVPMTDHDLKRKDT
ncbi:hypothetical protein ES703_69796 [subsurface metagenome]